MSLKICDSHLTCEVANNSLNICQQVEVVEMNKDGPLPSLAVQ